MTKQELGNTVIYPVKGSFKPIISIYVLNKVQDLLGNKSIIIEG